MDVKLKAEDSKKRMREYDISGEITLQTIEELSLKLKDCVISCDDLTINLKQITGFDVAAFQFFYSLKNSFIRDKKKLLVNCSLSEEVTQLLKNCGIEDLKSVLSIKRED